MNSKWLGLIPIIFIICGFGTVSYESYLKASTIDSRAEDWIQVEFMGMNRFGDWPILLPVGTILITDEGRFRIKDYPEVEMYQDVVKGPYLIRRVKCLIDPV